MEPQLGETIKCPRCGQPGKVSKISQVQDGIIDFYVIKHRPEDRVTALTRCEVSPRKMRRAPEAPDAPNRDRRVQIPPRRFMIL